MATRKRIHRLRSKSKRRLRGGEGGAFNNARANLLRQQLPANELSVLKETATKELMEMYSDFQYDIKVATNHAELKKAIDDSIGKVCNSKCELNEERPVDTTKDIIITNFHKWVDRTGNNINGAPNKNALEAVLKITSKAELCILLSYIGKLHVSPNIRNFEFSEQFIPPVPLPAASGKRKKLNLGGLPRLIIAGGKHKKHNKQTKRLRRRS